MSTPAPAHSTTPVFRPQRVLFSPFSNKSLEEIERLLYISGDPFHEVLSLRGASLDRTAYEANLKTMRDFVETIGKDLCLTGAEIQTAMPSLAAVPDDAQPDLF